MKKFTKVLTCVAAMCSLVACGKNNNNKGIALVTDDKAEQLHFEEEYISGKYSYAEGGKFAVSVITNLGTIAAGVAFDSPTSVVGGIFSLLNTFGDNFAGNKGPTIANVMNKLAEMDGKLDAINEKLDKNYSQLATETIRTQAMVDQVLLEEQEEAISNFNTQYVEKVQDFQRNYADYMEQSYKAFVKDEQSFNLYVNKENNEWHLIPVMEEGHTPGREVQIKLDDFNNSKTFLDKNYNTVTTGFMDEFATDIESNIKDVTLPSGMKQDTLRDFVGAHIIDNFTKKYYEDNHDKVLEIRNLTINTAKQISGKSTKSILDRYFNRMKYMFNFAGEMKAFAIGSLANLAHQLDVSTAMAAQACLIAGTSQDEIRTEFLAARENIKTYYDSIKAFNDNYCFLTNTNLTGGFYRAMFKVNYTDRGNHPTFHADFKLDEVNDTRVNEYKEVDITKKSFLNDLDHVRIATRFGLMRQNGIVKSENYIKYLLDAKVMPEKAYKAYERLHADKCVSEDGLRFFTGLTTRGMNSGDKFQLSYADKGNPKGDYFNNKWTGTYKSAHDSDCWNGKVAETTYIDAISGQIMAEKKVAAYATYSESHWYWSQDEYWAFVDNPFGNYFFTLENVID